MVYRVAGLACALALTGCASSRYVPDIAQPYVEAQTRASAISFYLREPRGGTSLYQLPGIATARHSGTPSGRIAPLPVPVPVDLRIAAGTRVGDLATMWAMSIGYTPYPATPSLAERRLPKPMVGTFTADQMRQRLLADAGVRVDLFPESRLILITEAR